MSSHAGDARCRDRGAPAGGVVARLIDRFNAMVRGDGPGAPVGRLIGFRPTSIEPGKAIFVLEAGPQHANPMGTLHGRITCDVPDAATRAADATTRDEGQNRTTREPAVDRRRTD